MSYDRPCDECIWKADHGCTQWGCNPVTRKEAKQILEDREMAKRPTNADRIRAMTDEELALWLSEIMDCNECKISTDKCMASMKMCAKAWKDWLQAEWET